MGAKQWKFFCLSAFNISPTREGQMPQISLPFESETAPEPAMEWDQYENRVRSEWHELLETDPPPAELPIQRFLERHPCLIPGAFNPHSQSGHNPWLAAVISQAPLPSYNRRVPDFMWFSRDSATDQPVLVEIESPRKRWFDSRGVQSPDLSQALSQISDWKAWFNLPENLAAFRRFYKLDVNADYPRRFKPGFVLIFGRRREWADDPAKASRRSHMVLSEDTAVMTYDRLAPDPKARQFICCKSTHGRFEAISIPPTFQTSNELAHERSAITGLDSAIRSNPYLSDARKEFLIRRSVYWDNWARARGEPQANPFVWE